MKLSDRQIAALIALADIGVAAGAEALAWHMTDRGSEMNARAGRSTGDALVVKGLAVKVHGRYEVTDAGRTAADTLRGPRQ